MTYRSIALAVLLGLVSSPGFAQSSDAPDPGKVKVRFGPVWMNPTIGLTNVGVDDNVFNDPPEKDPKKDFTLTLSPYTDLWLRLGRTWLVGKVKEDIVWYQKYASERSGNNSYGVSWKGPFGRFAALTSADFASTRERPGYEIDARAQHHLSAYTAGLDFKFLSKTSVGVSIDRDVTSFDAQATFLGINLADQLNEHTTSTNLNLRHELTPLTTVTASLTRSQTRFETSPLRDSDTSMYSGTISFDQAALLKGSVKVGYEKFEPRDPSLPGYTGGTFVANLAYTLAGATRLDLVSGREVQYSYDVNQPYYVQTGATVALAQQLFGPLDVVGRAGIQQLDYRNRAGAIIEAPDRQDVLHTYGVGIGFHLGRELRFGIDLDKSQRISPLQLREYQGLKIGTSLTYGLVSIQPKT